MRKGKRKNGLCSLQILLESECTTIPNQVLLLRFYNNWILMQLGLKSVYLFLGLSIFLSACADLSITKRRHRPGFHVDFAGDGKSTLSGNTKANKFSETITIQKYDSTMEFGSSLPVELEQIDEPNFHAGADLLHTIVDEGGFFSGGQKDNVISVQPDINSTIREFKMKVAEGEKYGKWRTAGLVAMFIGITAVLLIVMGFAFLVAWYSKEYKSNDDRPVLGLLFAGGILGLIALIEGGLSKKRIKQTGEKGKGFAIAGLITGIVALGLMILTFLVMAIGGPPDGR